MLTGNTQDWRGMFAPAAMWIVFIGCVWNAFAYQQAVSAPMLASDNWLFVDTFLRNALEGKLDLGDFLVKRTGVDHAQPLSKLIMLWNYRVFGLDMRIEGLIGLIFGVAGLLLIYHMAMADSQREARTLAFYLLLAAVAAVQLSLNSSTIYSSSMVTLGFIPFFFAFAAIYAAWSAMEHGRWQLLLMAMLVYGVVGDNSAILLAAILIPVVLLHGWRLGRLPQAWRHVLVILAALIASRAFHAAFGEVRGETLPEFNVPMQERLVGLAMQWRDWWRFALVPAASGLTYAAPLQNLFGEKWQAMQVVVGSVVLIAHGWFWWCASKTRTSATWFLAIALMLLFYAYLAGLLTTRVFVRGPDYLDQPRYVSFYQLGIVALLLMGCARSLQAGANRYMYLPVACVVILLQAPLSWSAGQEVAHIKNYYITYTEQVRELARSPTTPPVDCLPTLTLCPAPLDFRLRVLRMLRDHEVNVFSPRFRRLYPAYYVDPQLLN